ncbi:MAG: TonB-dependent receptor [Carboxylicivirga sp.]|nr:TonB-dependent receptor [Carboxylicivirga sp.]
MKKIITFFIYVWFLSISTVWAQSIEVDCQSKPLNELLIEWRNQFDLQLSFNDELLSHYKITIKKKFKSINEALAFILKDLPLSFEKNQDVYIIFQHKKEKIPKKFHLVGKIIERGTGEPLPFSHIKANDQQAVTDVKGMFSFSFDNDSVFDVVASHLGCYMLDTLLRAGSNHKLTLTPSAIGIKEVVVTNNIVEKSTQIGESSGLTSLNHHIANYLPGNGDNSVFNLLRLQPGILAAGEQANDLIIWGSPEGTSRVKFDGFTIWGLKNFSDNISAVNPYLAKNIEVNKGGYDATNDDVVGGIVNISGKNGSVLQPGFNLFINNQTINGMVELPMSQKSSVMLAFRQTYYNLFGSEDLNYLHKMVENSKSLSATPEYDFRDFNLKYSFQGDNGDLFYISLLHADDNFEVDIDSEVERERQNGEWVPVDIKNESEEDNTQMGGTAYYGKTWANGHSTSIKLSYSALQSKYSLLRQASLSRKNNNRITSDLETHNDVNELSLKWENKLLHGEHHAVTLGTEWVNNDLTLTEDTFNTQYINVSERANRLILFAQDKIQMSDRFSLTAGLRYNHSFFVDKIYFDPRISLSYRASGNIKLNASWGHYHQYLVKTSIDDDNGNYRYSWTLADGNEVPVIKSEHFVIGAAYTPQDFLFSIDSYYKTNEGLTRYIRKENIIIYGDSRSYGIDFYSKKDFKGHSIWASYSLGKNEEHYPLIDGRYRRALQDQRHEVKLATLFNLGSFHLSTIYVFGSGFPIYSHYKNEQYIEPDYNRLDASIVYRLALPKFNGEVGISVLNVTNADNIKYSQFSRIPIEQLNTVYINGDAVPFTPLLYLKLHY